MSRENTVEQLRYRAWRILHDGQRHEKQAVQWAIQMTASWRTPLELLAIGFKVGEVRAVAPW